MEAGGEVKASVMVGGGGDVRSAESTIMAGGVITGSAPALGSTISTFGDGWKRKGMDVGGFRLPAWMPEWITTIFTSLLTVGVKTGLGATTVNSDLSSRGVFTW